MEPWNKDELLLPCPEAVNMTHDQQNEVWHDFQDFVDSDIITKVISMSHLFDISVQEY